MSSPPSSSGKKRLTLFLLLFTAASCSFLGLHWLFSMGVHAVTPIPDPTQPPEPTGGSRGLHLGTVLVPSSTPPGQAYIYDWRAESLVPPE